jgi:esterase/lipase superfamily enzyme
LPIETICGGITRKVEGGLFGIDQRATYLARAKRALQESQPISPPVYEEYATRDEPDRFRDLLTPAEAGVYRVWFCTNRKPIDASDRSKGYSPERDIQVHYGACDVFVPKSHKIGSIGSPWWKMVLTLTDDRLRLIVLHALESDSYWQNISAHLATVREDDQAAVVFVHGYNVSFDDAALRAAQIGFDLSIKGVMSFFSWPSRGELHAYPADEATIEASEEHITKYLVDLVENSRAKSVHLIAHSMGNRGVLRAVDRIAATATQRTGKLFRQIVLAAADVDVDVFRSRCAAYTRLAERTTLYISPWDKAIEVSHWLHGFARAGLMPPPVIVPGIDTVNVANVDLSLIGHGYIAAAKPLLMDMYQLITQGIPPEKRFGLDEVDYEGLKYWQLRA